MKVETESLPGSRARLTIEVEPERVQAEMEKAYRRLSSRVTVPGFRRGKAPRVLVERTLGEGTVLSETMKELVPDAIADAVEQEQLDPVAEPNDLHVISTDPLVFEVTIPLVPTVALGDYRSIRVDREPVSVTDEDVDEIIQQLRDREAVWVTPEPPREAELGDQLTVDIEEIVDGESVGQQEEIAIVLGDGPLLPELDQQLIGAEEGGDYEFSVTLPEDYQDEEHAGKQAIFRIHVHSIKEKQLPELDDDFAARVGENVSTVEELCERIRENLQARAEAAEQERFAEEIVGKLVGSSTVELPDVLVEREVDHRIAHLEDSFKSQGIPLNRYLELTGRTTDALRDELRPAARERLIRGLVLSEVAHAENISVDDAAVDAEIERMLERIDEEEREAAGEILDSEEWRRRIRSDLYDKYLMDRLTAIATGEVEASEPSEMSDDQVEEQPLLAAEEAVTEQPGA